MANSLADLYNFLFGQKALQQAAGQPSPPAGNAPPALQQALQSAATPKSSGSDILTKIGNALLPKNPITSQDPAYIKGQVDAYMAQQQKMQKAKQLGQAHKQALHDATTPPLPGPIAGGGAGGAGKLGK